MSGEARTHEEERAFRRFLERATGFVIPEDRWRFLAPRFLDRLDGRGFADVGAYIAYLERDSLGRTEMEEIFEILTVRKTSFFRNPASFDALGQEVLPALARAATSPLPISIWSAGCSTGEEPHSIAMVADAALRPLGRSYYILATDIVKEALATAREGLYPEHALSGVPPDYRHYLEVKGGRVRVRDGVRESVEFAEHNLVHQVLPRSAVGPWDVIFCRNVFIYFGLPQAREVLRRFTNVLAPGGVLFLGHAEVFPEIEQDYEVVFWGDTFYYRKRVDPRVAPVRASSAPLARPKPTLPADQQETRVMRRPRLVPPEPTPARPTKLRQPPGSPFGDPITESGFRVRRGQGDTPTRAFTRGDTPRRIETRTIPRFREQPALPRELVVQAEHRLAVGDLEGAGRALRAAVSRAPRWAQPRLLLAEVYMQRGDHEYAARQLETAVEVEPLDARAHHLLGKLRASQGDHPRAEVSLRRALYLEPDFVDARYALAQTYRAQGQRDRACRELRNAIRTLRGGKARDLNRSGERLSAEAFIGQCEREIDQLGGSLEDSGIWRMPERRPRRGG